MVQNDIYDYKKIVGEQNQEEYLGPERQGELLKRCTILENVEFSYSGNIRINSSSRQIKTE